MEQEIFQAGNELYINLSYHEQAMAEKDREIAYLQSERLSAAAMGDQRDRDYHTLMRQAVEFAGALACRPGPRREVAIQFLASPEVQAWKELT